MGNPDLEQDPDSPLKWPYVELVLEPTRETATHTGEDIFTAKVLITCEETL